MLKKENPSGFYVDPKKHQLSLKIPALKKHIKYFFHHIE